VRHLSARFLLGAALVVTGCATPKSVVAPKCTDGRGEPISLSAVKSRLAGEGIPVSVKQELCDSDEIAELVSSDGSRLRCKVFTHPVYPKMREHPRSRYEGPNFSGKGFVIAFGNVDCWDYGEGATRASTLRKLRTIFRGFGATSQTVEPY
jgi:hypothetical protein